MPRRKKTRNKKISGVVPEKSIRFEVSLVILIGVLTFSAYLLLISLNRSLEGNDNLQTLAVASGRNFSTNAKKPADGWLKDVSLDFEIKMPSRLGEWIYKIGYVKSPTDDALSDQYVQIFVPVAGINSNNLEEKNKNILTIKKYAKAEWNKLEKGCLKGNQFYCETAGAKISEKNDEVFAYTKTGNCPKSIEARCRLADGIIESFRLK